ncbi:uncharacterized protein B0P05DRAFT_542002 [Gilbertella persicaria]|uniref:Uncharacterized protein n=1 Tax=Rhizopus stolonifer TaxID=4846 RepID=A0A367KI46_RHIST|nr:uncharacterized protein B0P05DRAFT_542002 [Gilbertella persicaria]KAI8079003.1 hypothetical protein B0P05DRAFT_542002 [Gilbertella persicaria]RCI01903.1 hypothetical protein CU098_007741 [Rhizopus stolonifer]
MDLSTVTATVDDIELLNILGLTSIPSSPNLCNDSLAVLDWDDMPELSEEDDDDSSIVTKRKHEDEEEDIFAELDFVEVPFVKEEQEPDHKKRKFVSDDTNEEALFNMNLQLEDDIRLALDLISS